MRYIPYLDGTEWHDLATRMIAKYGYELQHRDLFDLAKLTLAERRRYLWVRSQTMQARMR